MIYKGFFILLAIVTVPVYAIGVSPTRIIFESSGNSSHEITIRGDKLSPLAVEIALVERNGPLESIASKKSDCLSLSLPQAYMEPNQILAVSISRKENDPRCQSGSFYVVIETLAIEGPPVADTKQLRFASRLLVPVHINPASFSTLRVALHQGSVSIRNVGTGAVLYSAFDVHLGSGDQWVVIPGQRLAKYVRSDALLPGATVSVALSALSPGPESPGVRLAPSSPTTLQGE